MATAPIVLALGSFFPGVVSLAGAIGLGLAALAFKRRGSRHSGGYGLRNNYSHKQKLYGLKNTRYHNNCHPHSYGYNSRGYNKNRHKYVRGRGYNPQSKGRYANRCVHGNGHRYNHISGYGNGHKDNHIQKLIPEHDNHIQGHVHDNKNGKAQYDKGHQHEHKKEHEHEHKKEQKHDNDNVHKQENTNNNKDIYGHKHDNNRIKRYEKEKLEEIFKVIRMKDRNGCGLRLICELAGVAKDQLEEEEIAILALVGNYVGPGEGLLPNSARRDYQIARGLGKSGLDCLSHFASCPLNGSQIMNMITKFIS